MFCVLETCHMFLKPYIPTVLCSQALMFPKFYSPMDPYSQGSVLGACIPNTL